MARKVLIQILNGLERDIGTLKLGELGYCTDTQKLYIGTSTGNTLLVASQTAGDMLKSIYDTDNDGVVDVSELAIKLQAARSITLTGDVLGSVTFDGSKNVLIDTTIDKLTAQALTSEDLDTVNTSNKEYLGIGGNTVLNKPSGVDAFGLAVFRVAGGWYMQILYASNNVQRTYYRYYTGGAWTSWEEFYTSYNLKVYTKSEIDTLLNKKANTSHNHTTSQISDFPTSLPANGGNANTVGGFTVGVNVPANAKFTDTVYFHANSGVTAGTYRSVTVNAQGHVTGGTNPTTIAGYGITDALSNVNPTTTGAFTHGARKAGTASGAASATFGSGHTASGNAAFAYGNNNVASGNYSCAGGFGNDVLGGYSHAEGTGNTNRGGTSHVEGAGNNLASGSVTHVEGQDNLVSNCDYSHIEGYGHIIEPALTIESIHVEGSGNTCSASCAHVEGSLCTVTALAGHAEGMGCTASGEAAHAEGSSTIASGKYSHSEGMGSKAEGYASHAEGYGKTTDHYAHAEGVDTHASAEASHAEGNSTIASGFASHAEGDGTTASGGCAHAQGTYTEASAADSFATGYQTRATNNASTVLGKFNATMTNGGLSSNTVGDVFVIGNGISLASTSNAFRITYAGTVYSKGSYNTSGADYAEYFEWTDGNPNNEDRRGYFVTTEGDKIKIADSTSSFVIGIVSGNPCIIGNADEDWSNRWLKDEFGTFIMEEFDEEETKMVIDKQTREKTFVKTGVILKSFRFKENPDYDPTQEYIERKDRKEWSAIGMMGVLSVRDNGECKINSFCTVGDDGIAVPSTFGYRVIGRVSENVIKVIFK